MDLIDIEDWMIIGPMSEEWADIEEEKRRGKKNHDNEIDLYHDDSE